MSESAMDTFYERLGQSIRMLREQHDLTQRAVSVVLGLNRSSIANMERGTQHPSAFQLHQLARLFNVSVADIAADVPLVTAADPVDGWVARVMNAAPTQP